MKLRFQNYLQHRRMCELDHASGRGVRVQKVVSVIKYKTVRLSRNVWHQLPSDGSATYQKNGDLNYASAKT